MPSTQDSIAAEVRAALARARLNSTHVAAALGCSPSNASRKIAGRVGMSAVELAAIADLAGVSVAEFFSDEPPAVRMPEASAYAADKGVA